MWEFLTSVRQNKSVKAFKPVLVDCNVNISYSGNFCSLCASLRSDNIGYILCTLLRYITEIVTMIVTPEVAEKSSR